MILTAIDTTASTLGMLAAFGMIVLSIGLCVLYGFLIYWTIKFITQVPNQLKRIADALEKIAIKQR